MKMYTNNAGKERCNDGFHFWAWSVESFEENHHEIEVNEGDYVVEDVGLYIIKNINNVIWITKDNRIPSYDSMTEEDKKIIDAFNSLPCLSWDWMNKNKDEVRER